MKVWQRVEGLAALNEGITFCLADRLLKDRSGERDPVHEGTMRNETRKYVILRR
jgi:hypothetical protein